MRTRENCCCRAVPPTLGGLVAFLLRGFLWSVLWPRCQCNKGKEERTSPEREVELLTRMVYHAAKCKKGAVRSTQRHILVKQLHRLGPNRSLPTQRDTRHPQKRQVAVIQDGASFDWAVKQAHALALGKKDSPSGTGAATPAKLRCGWEGVARAVTVELFFPKGGES